MDVTNGLAQEGFRMVPFCEVMRNLGLQIPHRSSFLTNMSNKWLETWSVPAGWGELAAGSRSAGQRHQWNIEYNEGDTKDQMVFEKLPLCFPPNIPVGKYCLTSIFGAAIASYLWQNRETPPWAFFIMCRDDAQDINQKHGSAFSVRPENLRRCRCERWSRNAQALSSLQIWDLAVNEAVESVIVYSFKHLAMLEWAFPRIPKLVRKICLHTKGELASLGCAFAVDATAWDYPPIDDNITFHSVFLKWNEDVLHVWHWTNLPFTKSGIPKSFSKTEI